MSEIKGIVERAVKEHVESLGRDKWIVLVGGKSYDCWSSRIEGFVGKELPAGSTVEAAKNEKYNAKLNLPKDGGTFGGGGFKSGYKAPDPFDTAYNTAVMTAGKLIEVRAAKPIEVICGEAEAFIRMVMKLREELKK